MCHPRFPCVVGEPDETEVFTFYIDLFTWYAALEDVDYYLAQPGFDLEELDIVPDEHSFDSSVQEIFLTSTSGGEHSEETNEAVSEMGNDIDLTYSENASLGIESEESESSLCECDICTGVAEDYITTSGYSADDEE